MIFSRTIRATLATAICAAVTACGSGGVRSLPATAQLPPAQSNGSSPIRHVIIVIQENRTFNDFFATYPGADGTTTGEESDAKGRQTKINLAKTGLIQSLDMSHSYQSYQTARDGGKMDGFDRVTFGTGKPEGTYPYRYVNPNDIKPYWTLAKRYVLAEHMFQTQGSGSFTAHQDLIAGGTVVSPGEALVNLPGCGGPKCIWGCDAPKGTGTSLISKNGQDLQLGQGPFPCLKYATLRDLLDAKNVTWKYYAPQMCCSNYGKLMSAFDAIKVVRDGPEWKKNISTPQTNIFTDLTNHQLAAVSWIVPDATASDHPGYSSDTGPSWVAQVVNAVGESSYWNSTAIVIVWDDWGGFYDNYPPNQLDYGGLGFRVPALIVSPYSKHGYIAKTHYEFGSILRFIEDNWNLGRLGTSDMRARSIVDSFDYNQHPGSFTPIRAKYSKQYFLTERPSGLPVDTDM